ncbi:GNAT family N-acetyltransferase [Halorussus gelatinilyticus]|uniref:GNAT family N-acetyltransferase n=1 Tax=Halorussus gelatinilyticus TaxID=2937524 RepID=A0A8U0IQ03_9EURY|nr:GNAT family N-acetyltransferase [Halorussus gelatinilyticus]UPW02089.1 GNAT family N-acetyltransferase [Halorussus gelatinilyticus]
MSGPRFLDGDRVTLHVPTEDDVAFLLENENDPAVRRTRSASSPTGPEEVRRCLGGTLGRSDDTLALVTRVGGDRVGLVYLIREKPNDDVYGRAELAYWVAPGAQGNGYATDAARTVVEHGFDRLGFTRSPRRRSPTTRPRSASWRRSGSRRRASSATRRSWTTSTGTSFGTDCWPTRTVPAD